MANRTPDSSASPSTITGIPPDGTLCRGVEAVGDDHDFEPRHVEGPLVTRWVPVLNFTQLMIDGAVIDPETLEVVAEVGGASMDPDLV